jgi:c-di-GMP-binding flagellar brake protein YcgR
MGQTEPAPHTAHRGGNTVSPDILKSVIVNPDTPVFSGHIIDISAGGYLLKVTDSVEEGALIRIEFNVLINILSSIDEHIKGVEKKDNASMVRVEFKNLSQKSLNAINAIVFGYDKD